GAVVEADRACQLGGRLHGRSGEVEPDDARAAPCPRQRVGAEVALEVEEVEAAGVHTELVTLERPEVVAPAAEGVEVVERGLRVAGDALVPPLAVRRDPALLAHDSRRASQSVSTRAMPSASSTGSRWPPSGKSTSSLPGTRPCMRCWTDGGVKWSRSPPSTRTGTSIVGSTSAAE